MRFSGDQWMRSRWSQCRLATWSLTEERGGWEGGRWRGWFTHGRQRVQVCRARPENRAERGCETLDRFQCTMSTSVHCFPVPSSLQPSCNQCRVFLTPSYPGFQAAQRCDLSPTFCCAGLVMWCGKVAGGGDQAAGSPASVDAPEDPKMEVCRTADDIVKVALDVCVYVWVCVWRRIPAVCVGIWMDSFHHGCSVTQPQFMSAEEQSV